MVDEIFVVVVVILVTGACVRFSMANDERDEREEMREGFGR